jgi:hypothetical protein
MAELYSDIYKGSNTDRYNGYNTINADIKVSMKNWASRVAVRAKSVGNKLSERKSLFTTTDCLASDTDNYAAVKGGIKSVRKLFHVRSSLTFGDSRA